MKKIPTLFVRSEENRALVTEAVTPGCEWVLAGEGVPTRKYDGTSCLIKDGGLWKRYDAKAGKTPPPGFISAQEEPDPVTGHWPGWLPVTVGAENKWHHVAWAFSEVSLPDGTYELVGPKVQGGAEYWSPVHQLIRHGMELHSEGFRRAMWGDNNPRTIENIRAFLADHEWEGIVWHHLDGRMAKVKRKDFGLPWPVNKEDRK